MATRKPRVVLFIRNGIIEDVLADQELDIEILKVDIDQEAEVEIIYRLQPIALNPRAVKDNFQLAERFWKREEKERSEHASGPEN